MIFLLFTSFCLVVLGLGWMTSTRSPSPSTPNPRNQPRPQSPGVITRVEDGWTSLDDHQLTRLLEDNSPC